ncbi:MAG: hypothetical protein H7Z72_23605 [Bacteroidetes bacterium]|nr:hypothetical protein [Fibrella sp.]
MQSSSSSSSSIEPLTSRTYQVQTDTSTTVREKTVSNSITTTLRQTYYGQTNTNTVLVELLDFFQTDKSPLAVLLAELNPVNNRLVFDVSEYGDLLTVRNLEQVEAQWHELRPQIMHKYGRTPDGMAFIDGFGQQLRSETLIATLRHKGAYGVLFPGLFGPTRLVRNGISERLLKGFFGTVDLPLVLQTDVNPNPQSLGGSHLHVTGQIDTNRFDEDALRSLVKEAVDMVNFRIKHHIACEEDYFLDADGWLTAARQELTFTIENVYYHHTEYALKLV